MPEGMDRPKATMGGKKPAMTAAGKLRAASEIGITPSAFTVIRNEKGEPTGVTRPMPNEKQGPFGGRPVTVKKVDLANPASFKHGGTVKKSGWAKVEKGERVVPKEKAMADEKRDRSKSAMGGKAKASKKKSSKGGKKRVKKMSIRHSKNGGYIIEHEHEKPSPTEEAPENEEHTAPDMEALQQHVADHMEPQPEPQPEPQAGGAPPPAAGGAAAGGGMPPQGM